MEPIFIRVGAAPDPIETHPLEAFEGFRRSPNDHRVSVVIRGYSYGVAYCRSAAEAIALEAMILREISNAIREERELSPQSLRLQLLDINSLAKAFLDAKCDADGEHPAPEVAAR